MDMNRIAKTRCDIQNRIVHNILCAIDANDCSTETRINRIYKVDLNRDLVHDVITVCIYFHQVKSKCVDKMTLRRNIKR